MTVDPFVQLYSYRCKENYHHDSGWWIKTHAGILTSVPYGRTIEPTETEVRFLLGRSGVWGLKYSANESSNGLSSGIFMAKRPYSENNLKSKARNQYRKAAKYCTFKEIFYEDLLGAAFELNISTFNRQNRSDPMASATNWRNFCESFKRVQAARAFGVYVGDQLASYAIVVVSNNIAEIIIQSSSSDYLKFCPNNLLTFNITSMYLNETDDIESVCYGLRSVESTDSLDHYKISMGYSLILTKQVILFHPLIKLLLLLKFDLLLGFFVKLLGVKNYSLNKMMHMFDRYRLENIF